MDVKKIARLGLLLGVILIGQQIKIQHVTGSTINMVLLFATATVGLTGAIILSFLSPILAFAQGNMGFVIMVPAIGVGNAILCLAYHIYLKVDNYALKGTSLICGILLKATVLYLFALHVVGLPVPVATTMMGINQIITASIGTAIGLVIVASGKMPIIDGDYNKNI